MSENSSNMPLLIGAALLAAGIAYFAFEGDSSAETEKKKEPDPVQPPVNPLPGKAKPTGFYVTQKAPDGKVTKLGTMAPEKYNAAYQTQLMNGLLPLWKTETIAEQGKLDGLWQAWGHFTYPGGQPELPILMGQQYYKYADLIKK